MCSQVATALLTLEMTDDVMAVIQSAGIEDYINTH